MESTDLLHIGIGLAVIIVVSLFTRLWPRRRSACLSLKMANMCDKICNLGICRLFQHSGYSIYVLLLLLLTYLLNQLDRYMLAIVTKPMAQEIGYGDKICMTCDELPAGETHGISCNATNEDSCKQILNDNGTAVCSWDYNGQGFEYQLLAGPIFIVVYTLAGVVLGLAADTYNRKGMLAICLIFWSVMTVLTGTVKEYWQLAILRFGLGIGEAGCTPFAASLIGDYFTKELRATALGIYNWGIFLGYSMSYAFGNFITKADIMGQGWRWCFYLSGIPGVILGILIMATVKEPEKHVDTPPASEETVEKTESLTESMTACQRIQELIIHFLKPTTLLLCLAGSIRNGAGYVWGYNTQVYYETLGRTDIGSYMSWIPIVGGTTSLVIGGYISDRVVRTRGPHARIIVVVISLLCASPFGAGAIVLPFPWAYISLIPNYMIGEMWIGIMLAVIIEVIPSHLRTSAIALYLFIITNIGGNMPLLVPPLTHAFENAGSTHQESLRATLLILYPGMYVASALLFLVTLFVIKRDINKAQRYRCIDIKADDSRETAQTSTNETDKA